MAAPPPPPDLTGGFGKKGRWRTTLVGRVLRASFWVLVVAFLGYVVVMSVVSMVR
jgi:hypothetical protein